MPCRVGDVSKIAALERWLSSSDPATLAEVVPSPDFSRLAVICDLDDPNQAGLCMIAATDQILTPLVTFATLNDLTGSAHGTVITRPRWSADGQHLALASYEGLPPGEGYRLWIVKAEVGPSPTLLYEGVGVIAAHLWSPGGVCLAVADSDAGLVIVHPDGTSSVVDADAMRYPLGENAMAWLDDDQHLLYVSQAADRMGMWELEISTGHKRQVMALSQGEIAIPANVNRKSEVTWGALRGHMRQVDRGAVLYFQSRGKSELRAISLPNIEFDPASHLLVNDEGSLWAFTVWREGQRVPFIVDRPAGRGCSLTTSGSVTQVLGWSDVPPRLWVLLHPPQVVGLDVGQPAELVAPANEMFSLDLTPAELLYLLEALGADSMIGLATPLAGVPEDETGRLKESARASLVSKGFVTELPDGQVQIDLTVGVLVQCCASPQQTWTVTLEGAKGERDVRHVHQAQDLMVEDAVLASGSHRLTPLRDKAAVLRRIEERMCLKGQSAAPGEPFALPEEILFRVKEIVAVAGEETAARYLVGAGVAEATATRFAQALAQPLANGSISRWSLVGEEAAASTEEGISILESTSGLWLLQPSVTDGTVQVEIFPADATTALRRIADLLD